MKKNFNLVETLELLQNELIPNCSESISDSQKSEY